MRITSKGQVTIPQEIRERAGLFPLSEVSFELRDNGDVVLRPLASKLSAMRQALEKVRGSANAQAFKGLSTDEFMKFLRG
jgi:AbrB family looped-hinge helix DNA binding protein